MEIVKYSQSWEKEWDEFVSRAKNSHFFFYRSFMEYHADRFNDWSLLFFNKEKIVAILPANNSGVTLFSHQGLTFGGLLVDEDMKTPLMLELFKDLQSYLQENGFLKLMYKAIPHIYHQIPCEEDLFALHWIGAKLYRRDVSSTIDLEKKPKFQNRRVRMIKKAINNGVQFKQSDSFDSFWGILNQSLQGKYATKPVHSLEEIRMLSSRFPKNIKLFVAYYQEEILAGSVIFENKKLAHAQYIASSLKGKEIGALDGLFNFLINERYKDFCFFDFGISTENEGKDLNHGLIDQKEGFGARAVCHDFYELEIEQ